MPAGPSTVAQWARGARLFEGLGSAHRAISSQSAEAGRYFDQGMALLWAFNHDEATRSFAKAAELDPQCGICFWGVALTIGPNYNFGVMDQARANVAAEAIDKARAAPHASELERALIEAVAQRYPKAKPLDPSSSPPFLQTYAAAMKQVATRFPQDLDVQTLYAEALMNTIPWRLWDAQGKPAPATAEILQTLESVLKRDPKHAGANHYYIHAVEAGPHPEMGLAASARLPALMPGAGHLQHMPAHILQRVGQYEEAAEANRKGVAADQAYFAATTAPDYYAMYLAHNYQFLAFATAMEGRKAETLQSVSSLRKAAPEAMLMQMPGVDWSAAEGYFVLLRFGVWEQLLAEPAPTASLPGLMGGYLYARGTALAATGQVAEAKVVLGQLQQRAAAAPADAPAGNNTLKDVLGLAVTCLEARIASAENRSDDAIALLKEAALKEDHLSYDEPKDWFVPVREVLGAELLKAHRAAEAEKVYWEDLARNPHNGWALFGLRAALTAQSKSTEAKRVGKQFDAAWQHADITLSASAF